MPIRILILGPELGARDAYPSSSRAAVVLAPVPFWWWGESEALVPGPDGDSPPRHNLRSEGLPPEGPHVDYYWKIAAKHPVLRKLDHCGYWILEGDDVQAFAALLGDVGSDPGEPNAKLLLLAARMVERAAQTRCVVGVVGR